MQAKAKDLVCDRAATLAQLQLLGYTPADAIHLRAIGPDGAQKISAKNWTEIPWSQLQSLQQKGFNLYLVVNGCGHTDAEVTAGKAIFYEHDTLSKDIQKDLWQGLGLPEPTIQVDTGGKSIHSYWVFDRPIPIAQWRLLQSNLLDWADADRSIKNPSRVMRLAGWVHQTSGLPATIVSQTGQRYTFEALRAIVPAPAATPAQTPAPTHHSTYTGTIPLEKCLAKIHREWLNGLGEGSRNESGAKLARDLIGAAARLDYLGICYDGTPRQLLEDFGSRCTPPLPAREIDVIWQSASKSNPTACLDDQKLINCVAAWERSQQQPKATGVSGSNLISLPKNQTGGGGGDGEPPIGPDERFRLDVLCYASEPNPFRQRRLKGEICSTYRISAKDLAELVAETTASTKAPKAKEFTGAEFLKLETEGLQWLIPGIIPARGVSILAGDPGSGKTTLAYDLAAAILYGDEFLGESPSKLGKVLFVSSDELPCFAQDKLVNRGFKWNEDWRFKIDWDVSQKQDLEQSLEDFKPQLVVVDSFSAIHRDALFDENSSQAKSTVYWLESIANQYQCAVLLIHHANKNREQKGVNKLRGSSAIAGACSAVLLLTGDGEIKTLSSPKIRGAEPFKWGIKLVPENGHFKVCEGKADDAESKSLGERIMELFQLKYPTARLEAALIHTELGGAKDSIWKALDRLVKRGLLAKRPSTSDHRVRVYGLPLIQTENTGHLEKNNEVLSPPPVRLNVSSNFDETHTQQEEKLLDTILDNYWTPDREIVENDTCPATSNPCTAMDTAKILDTTPDRGGEGVSVNGCPVIEDVAKHTEDTELCLDSIRIAIATSDREFAQAWAGILKEVCAASPDPDGQRTKIWASLSEAERAAFKALL